MMLRTCRMKTSSIYISGLMFEKGKRSMRYGSLGMYVYLC